MRRALVFSGAGAFLVGLAFLVARPPVPDAASTPYSGTRGASLAKATGLAISYQRGDELRAVEPTTVLRAGDALVFKVRGERPRQLEVRVRDGAPADERVVFPAADAKVTSQVLAGEYLPRVTVGPAPGKVSIAALFSDRPRAIGTPPDGDTEVVTAVIAKE